MTGRVLMHRDGTDGASGLFYRFAPLWLAHLALGVVVGLIVASTAAPVYTSTASALVAANASDGSRSVSSASTIINAVMPTIVQLSTSASALSEVAQATGVDESEVKQAVSVSSSTNSLIINVSATATSAETAQAIAEAEVTALRHIVSELSVSPQEETYLTLTDVDAASLPTEPSGPSQVRYGVYGGVVGAAVGLVVSLVLFRRRANNAADDGADQGLSPTPEANRF